MTIYELAEELGTKLAECEEYIALKSAEVAQEEDENAKKLMEVFSQKRTELTMEAQKPDITKDELMNLRTKMEEESSKLMENDNIRKYYEAVSTFDSLMKTINNLIIKPITPEQEGGCDSGDCATCGGCH